VLERLENERDKVSSHSEGRRDRKKGENSRANSDEILHNVSVDSLSRVSHVDFSGSISEVGL